jgi:hypothetical protein
MRSGKTKDRQCNGQKKGTKYNDLEHTTHKTKDWTTRTPLKTGDELRCSWRLGSPCTTSGIILIIVFNAKQCPLH